MPNKKTSHFRIYNSTKKNLKRRFPNVREADLIETMYNTSPIRMDLPWDMPKKNDKKTKKK